MIQTQAGMKGKKLTNIQPFWVLYPVRAFWVAFGLCIWEGVFLFSLQDKQNSHKTYKENKMFYFFLFWGRQRGKQEENSIFFIKQQKYQPKEKDIQHCVWKICKNSKGVTILLILSHLYTNTYKTWMNNRGNIFLNKKIKTQAFNTYPRKTGSFI